MQGRCALFSGRPDPVWTVSQRDAASLARIWSRLLPHTGPAVRPPALGYRGCCVSGAGGEWAMSTWDNVKKVTSSDANVLKYVFERGDAVAESVLYKYPA